MEGIQPTVSLGNDNSGFGNGIWLFAILALMWGGGNAFGRGGYSSPATTEDLAAQSNFTRLEAQGTAIGQAVNSGFTNVGNGLSALGYDLATKFGSLEKDMATCCCEMKQMVLENRYLNEKNTASIISKLDQNKIEALQAKVSELQLQQALSGVVKYPTFAAFSAVNPFCPTSSTTTPTT